MRGLVHISTIQSLVIAVSCRCSLVPSGLGKVVANSHQGIVKGVTRYAGHGEELFWPWNQWFECRVVMIGVFDLTMRLNRSCRCSHNSNASCESKDTALGHPPVVADKSGASPGQAGSTGRKTVAYATRQIRGWRLKDSPEGSAEQAMQIPSSGPLRLDVVGIMSNQFKDVGSGVWG